MQKIPEEFASTSRALLIHHAVSIRKGSLRTVVPFTLRAARLVCFRLGRPPKKNKKTKKKNTMAL